MKKILLFLSLSVFAISCNNDFDVSAKPLAATVNVDVNATVSDETVCSYDFTLAVDGDAKVYYVVLPTSDPAPTSSEIFNSEYADETPLSTETVDLAADGIADLSVSDLASGTSYTVYAVSVNKSGSDLSEGVRSEEVFKTTFNVAEYASLANATADFAAATSFTGAPSLGSDSDFSPFTPTVASVSATQYTFNTFWGTVFIAEVFGNPAYANQFNYGGTLTINPDLTVTIVGNAPAAWDNAGGSGTYNPCDKTITYRLNHSLFTSGGQPAPVDVVVTLNN
jgi:hypothetical protein